MREQVVDVPPQEVITEDNVVVSVDAVIYYEPSDPQRLVYNVANFLLAVTKLAQTNLRNVVGDMDLDDALTSRDKINLALRQILDDATDKWGVRVVRVEIQRIDPPPDVMSAMHEQMKAERTRRAVVTEADGAREAAIARAEGDKQSAILSAEGIKERQILEAQGEAEAIQAVADAERYRQETVAEGEAAAVRSVYAAIHEGDPTTDLLAIKYLEALQGIADGRATKIFLPGRHERHPRLGRRRRRVVQQRRQRRRTGAHRWRRARRRRVTAGGRARAGRSAARPGAGRSVLPPTARRLTPARRPLRLPSGAGRRSGASSISPVSSSRSSRQPQRSASNARPSSGPEAMSSSPASTTTYRRGRYRYRPPRRMASTLNPESVCSRSADSLAPSAAEPGATGTLQHDLVRVAERDPEDRVHVLVLLDQPDHLLRLVADVLGGLRQVQQAPQRRGVDVLGPGPEHPQLEAVLHLVEPVVQVADLGGQALVGQHQRRVGQPDRRLRDVLHLHERVDRPVQVGQRRVLVRLRRRPRARAGQITDAPDTGRAGPRGRWRRRGGARRRRRRRCSSPDRGGSP